MGRGKGLSEVERAKIDAYFDAGLEKAEIARKLARSASVIGKYLANKDGYGTAKRSGRPKKLSLRSRRAIIKAAKGKSITSKQVISSLKLKVSDDTVLRVLHESGEVKRLKYKRKPLLTASHKTARIGFCRFNIDRADGWKNLIFSDEKKFNLDGPDGYDYYWHALDNSKTFLSKDIHKKESVMIWGAFNFFGTAPLAFLDGTINSSVYQSVLQRHLLPFMRGLELEYMIFQQDNARPHVSNATINWLERHGIETLDWPAYSPDLNPIENLWGLLVQRVYANGRCFNNVVDLKVRIEKEWKGIEKTVLQGLILSMKNRMVEVLLNSGGNTKY